jgi:S1-C subfamily serine protease
MSHPARDLMWVCPSCARRVPRNVETCRCGSLQTDARPIGRHAADAPESRGAGWAMLLLVLGIGLGAALAVIPDLRAALPGTSAPSPSPVVEHPAKPAMQEPPAAAGPAEIGSNNTLAQDTTPAVIWRTAPADMRHAPASPASLEDVISEVVPAVVSIQAGSSAGTGFYVRPNLVITNVHVIEGHSSVQLRGGGKDRTARVVSRSPGADLAILEVYDHDPQQPTLKLGTATGLRVGQEVIAVGSALGVLSNTVTRGIVSAVRRAGDISLIQTDAAINPGNSGGPLVDRAGFVIGVNSMGVAKSVAESLSFAVAIDHVRPLLNGGPSHTAATPLTGLDAMLRGNAGPSEGDRLREQGKTEYDKVLQWAAQGAHQIDAYWTQNARTCVTSSSHAGDRAWFAVYDSRGVRVNLQVSGCEDWLEQVTRNAERIRDEIRKATETARRNGVYPGVMRDLQRRYKLEWDWDR